MHGYLQEKVCVILSGYGTLISLLRGYLLFYTPINEDTYWKNGNRKKGKLDSHICDLMI